MANFPGFPIFDTADRLCEQADQNGYPDVATRLSKLPLKYKLLERDLTLSFQYLLDYTGTAGTFNRFRGEIQRFLNYLWIIAGRTLNQVDAEVIEYYLDRKSVV